LQLKLKEITTYKPKKLFFMAKLICRVPTTLTPTLMLVQGQGAKYALQKCTSMEITKFDFLLLLFPTNCHALFKACFLDTIA
jgi:hypothetical protein